MGKDWYALCALCFIIFLFTALHQEIVQFRSQITCSRFTYGP
jgi:hypothetical protein